MNTLLKELLGDHGRELVRLPVLGLVYSTWIFDLFRSYRVRFITQWCSSMYVMDGPSAFPCHMIRLVLFVLSLYQHLRKCARVILNNLEGA